MKKAKRYDVSGLLEAQFEPGSRGQALKNLLGIKSKREMDRVEQREQIRALEELLQIYDVNHCFTADDVCKIHKVWLRLIYSWAGRYRRVNLAKADLPFAPAGQIPKLMAEFERDLLRKFTPCRFDLRSEVIEALAVVHTELILIHPFREGNGRVARLLANLMASQAGLPLLDFGMLKGRRREEYFSAVRAGLDRNYKPMERLFSGVVDKSLRIRPRE